MEEGTLRVGDKLAVRPGDESTVVKTIGARNLSVRCAEEPGWTLRIRLAARTIIWPKGIFELISPRYPG